MTEAQRATLELVLAHMSGDLQCVYYASDAAGALRAALGTCGNCRHSSAWPDGVLACNNTRGLNREEVGPGESCSGWTAKEGA